jgi:hypothetical protein
MVYGVLTDSRLKEAIEKALNLEKMTQVTVHIKKAPSADQSKSA